MQQYKVKRNPIRRKPVVDHDADTVTFAVTFKWRRPWAMDHCEVGVLGGELRRALVAKFGDWEQLAGIDAVETWEPREERHIGRAVGPIHFPDR